MREDPRERRVFDELSSLVTEGDLPLSRDIDTKSTREILAVNYPGG